MSDIPNKTNTISKLKCCSAIAHLESTNANKYKHAAKLFMEVAFGIENSFNEVSIVIGNTTFDKIITMLNQVTI